MTVYERIEELRKNKGISQNKLEKELGFSNGLISKWKDRVPSSTNLKKVADYFDTSINYLLTGEDDPEKPVYYFNSETAEMAQELFENKGMRLLFDAARGSSQQTLKATADFLKAMKEEEGDAD